MDFRHLLEQPNRISAEDVLRMRREVFGDAVVSIAEAEGIFHLNDSIADTCNEWDMFFVEAMTDYCVNQANPHGYVSETNATWLMQRISADGHLKSDTELELLIRIIEKATSVPDALAAYALSEVAHAVLHGNGELLRDETLTPGVIGKPEAQLIRRIMYGVGAEGRIRISQAEVEVLFDLNDQTVETENHPEWNDVFVKAVAAHLMMACGYENISRNEALRRDEWLDETDTDTAGMLSRTLSSFGSVLKGATWSDALKTTYQSDQEAWNERNSSKQENMKAAEPVSSSEAKWLAARINRDGVLHANEKALLKYIKQEAVHIDPVLQPLLEKVA